MSGGGEGWLYVQSRVTNLLIHSVGKVMGMFSPISSKLEYATIISDRGSLQNPIPFYRQKNV